MSKIDKRVLLIAGAVLFPGCLCTTTRERVHEVPVETTAAPPPANTVVIEKQAPPPPSHTTVITK